MGRVQENYTVCDYCKGVIPDGADRIQGVNGSLILHGQGVSFQNLDFCCTAHMGAWIQTKPPIATPDPPYAPPPTPDTGTVPTGTSGPTP